MDNIDFSPKKTQQQKIEHPEYKQTKNMLRSSQKCIAPVHENQSWQVSMQAARL